jgi:hypothetical protein
MLRSALPGSEVIQDDGQITIVGADREQVPELVDSLVGAGIRVYRVAPQEPTLEDVYFTLHGEGEGVS